MNATQMMINNMNTINMMNNTMRLASKVEGPCPTWFIGLCVAIGVALVGTVVWACWMMKK